MRTIGPEEQSVRKDSEVQSLVNLVNIVNLVNVGDRLSIEGVAE